MARGHSASRPLAPIRALWLSGATLQVTGSRSSQRRRDRGPHAGERPATLAWGRQSGVAMSQLAVAPPVRASGEALASAAGSSSDIYRFNGVQRLHGPIAQVRATRPRRLASTSRTC